VTANSVLGSGEPGFETDTGKEKIGDGVTAWTSLPYVSGSPALAPTTIKTSAYSAVHGDFVPVDTTSGDVPITLPTAPTDKSLVGIKMIGTASGHTVTFSCGGSDVLNKAGGLTTGTLSLINQGVLLQYFAGTAIWYVQSDDLPLASLATAYGSAPNPDTPAGSSVADGTYAPGGHSHAQSPLYDQFGVNQLNVVHTSGGAVTIPDTTVFQSSWVTLTAACTFTFPAAATGKRFNLYMTQDATGSRVPTLPANISWTSGVVPTWSTTPALTDRVTFECVDGLNWAPLVVLGMNTPPVPLNIVQTVNLSGAVSAVTFASNITAGNGILAILGPDSVSALALSGGGCTWQHIGVLPVPAAGPTVTVVGATGSTSYQYEITYVSALGTETTVSAATSITNGNATLSGSNYNSVGWAAAPAGTVSVNVYGRVSGSLGLLATVAVGTVTWHDTGTPAPGAVAQTINVSGSLTCYNYNTPLATPFVDVWLGTASSGGGGTATISLGTVCQTGTFFEIQAATLDSVSIATGAAGHAGTASSSSPITTPTVTAGAAGEMAWVVTLIYQTAIGTNPASPWVVGQVHNSQAGAGWPAGGPSYGLQYAYQPSTTLGGTYTTTWTPEYSGSYAFSSISFLLKS
jgi:hypothetical protein